MNSQKKQLLKKIWYWIKITSLLLGLTCGSILIYQWWARKQELKKLRQEFQKLNAQAQQQYNLQNIHLVSVSPLVNSPVIHSFFTDLLNTYVKKFAKRKNLDISHLPLKFAGLYADSQTGNGYGEMGRCFPHQAKEINISLNRLYLLNKFGQDKYFTSNPQYGDYTYINISFDKMIKTCSHELAHYFQLLKHGKSSCESDLVLNNGNYDGELAKEHEKFTQEIYRIIRNSEYSELESKWKEIN